MKRICFWLAMILMVGLSTLAFGQPGGEVDPNAAVDGFTDALSGGQWGLLAAFVGLILLWIGQKVYAFLKGDEANKDWLPIMAVVLAGVGGLCYSYVADASWLKAIGACVMAVMAAMGQYDVLKKTKAGVKKLREKRNGG